MENIASIIETLNKSRFVIILVLLIVALVVYGVKKGAISYRGKGLSIGGAEKENKVLSLQYEWMESFWDATIIDLPKDCEYYHSKYVISKVKQIWVKTIYQNHITDDDEYIDTKFDLVYNTILKYTEKDFFRSDEFKKEIRNKCEKTVKKLAKIRAQYS